MGSSLISSLVPKPSKSALRCIALAFPGLHVSVEELSTLEDTVVLRWTATGGSPSLQSSALASNQKSLTGITRSRCAAGKIIESWTEWDQLGELRELGLLPS